MTLEFQLHKQKELGSFCVRVVDRILSSQLIKSHRKEKFVSGRERAGGMLLHLLANSHVTLNSHTSVMSKSTFVCC